MTERVDRKRKSIDDDAEKETTMAESSIFNWFSDNRWHQLMLRSTPVRGFFDSLVDFSEADLHTLVMLKSPWNVTLTKSKHAGEGLPRPHLFYQANQPSDTKWWQDLFERGFIKESADIIRDRRYIVISHMIAVFTLDGNLGRLRVDDFYYPSFWVEVLIDMPSRRVLSIRGRHAEATGFHLEQHQPWPIVNWDLIGVAKISKFRATLSDDFTLSVWDEESEHVAFEIVCNLKKFFKVTAPM